MNSWIDVIASGVSVVPILIVDFGMIPGLWWDCCRMCDDADALQAALDEVKRLRAVDGQSTHVTVCIFCW